MRKNYIYPMTRLFKELKQYASPARKKSNERFFKTGKGEYGEHDQFLGVRVPDIRKVAKDNLAMDFSEVQKNIESRFHEVRLCAIIILVEKNKQARKNRDRALQKQILDFYLRNLDYVNNWDLVDVSAYYIVGQALIDGLEKKKLLDNLVQSENLWKRRVGIVATWAFIRKGDIDIILRLSKKLLDDKEDLMHKAVGWMLREAWKRDAQRVEDFLRVHYHTLPRTTLRYAIERMREDKRKQFLFATFYNS